MLEMAIVSGVSDAEKLREGVTTYIDVARKAYALTQEINPNDMPGTEAAQTRRRADLSGGGKLYSYPLPKKWGVDPQVATNAGLTDSFAAVSPCR